MNASTPVFDWRDYLPLAKAETSKFYRKQERGRFRYEELLSVAVEALATSAGVSYAKKAIRGVLNDYVRDAYKLVRNGEMSEEHYLRTWGSLNPPPAAIRRVYVSSGIRHTFYTPGAYLTNAQLLCQYKVNSKHGKVSIALERSTCNDERSQTSSGWIRAHIEDDEQDFDPRSARLPIRGDVDHVEYTGRSREQRFSTICHNHSEDYKSGLGPQDKRFDDGKVTVIYYGKKPRSAAEVIRRIVVAPPLDAGISGRRTSCVVVSMRKFGLEPVPKDKLGHWREELAMEPRLRAGKSLISWHREAGHFEVEWGLPHFHPVSLWDLIDEDGNYYRRRKIFPPKLQKVPDWADILARDSLEQDVPRRLASGSACLGGSWQAEPTIFSGILPDRRDSLCTSNR